MQFGVETNVDKYIKMGAKIKSQCIIKKQQGICTPDMCENCRISKNCRLFTQSLSPFEEEYMNAIAIDMARDSLKKDIPNKSKPMRLFMQRLKWCAIIFGLFSIIPIIFLLLLGPGDEAPTQEAHARIYYVLEETHYYIDDFNNDNDINCQDYAVLFKYIWDNVFPEYKACCAIIRNTNPFSSMNHLFVRVTFQGTYFIEPQRRGYEDYLMAHVWGDKWDRKWDIVQPEWYWYKVMGFTE